MSNEEAYEIEDSYDKWTTKQARTDFRNRMERKMRRKELRSER